MRIAAGVARIVVAGLIVAAVVGQFVVSWGMVEDRAAFVVNFFSFFTILSNALGAIVLLVSAWFAFTRAADPEWLTLVRASATTYLATTLVVYNLLLREISLDQATTVPWSNEILHVWAPILVVLDWVFAPGRTRVAWSKLWTLAVFPIVWAIYTMIRGAIIGWYPYPFLDPRIAPGVGYGGVTVYVVAIAAFILLVGAGVVWLSRFRAPGDAKAATA